MIPYHERLSTKVTKQIAEDLKAKGQYLVQRKGILEAWEDHRFVEVLGEVNDLFVRGCFYKDVKFVLDDLTSPMLTRRIAATTHIQEMENDGTKTC